MYPSPLRDPTLSRPKCQHGKTDGLSKRSPTNLCVKRDQGVLQNNNNNNKTVACPFDSEVAEGVLW